MFQLNGTIPATPALGAISLNSIPVIPNLIGIPTLTQIPTPMVVDSTENANSGNSFQENDASNPNGGNNQTQQASGAQSQQTQDLSKNDSKNDKKKRKPYVKRACLHCKKAHAACDNARPCRRCQRLGLECIDSDPTPRKRRKKKHIEDGQDPNGKMDDAQNLGQQQNPSILLPQGAENTFFSLMPGAFNSQLLLQVQQQQQALNAAGVQNGELLNQNSMPNLFQPLIQMFSNQSANANSSGAITSGDMFDQNGHANLPFLPQINNTQSTSNPQILAIENGIADSPASSQVLSPISPSVFLTGPSGNADSPSSKPYYEEKFNKSKSDSGFAKDAFSFDNSEDEDEDYEEEDGKDLDEVMKNPEEENEELVTKNASNLQRDNTTIAVYEQPQESIQVYSQDVDQIGKMFQNFQIKVFQEFDNLKKKVSQIDERVTNLEKEKQKKD